MLSKGFQNKGHWENAKYICHKNTLFLKYQPRWHTSPWYHHKSMMCGKLTSSSLVKYANLLTISCLYGMIGQPNIAFIWLAASFKGCLILGVGVGGSVFIGPLSGFNEEREPNAFRGVMGKGSSSVWACFLSSGFHLKVTHHQLFVFGLGYTRK